MIFLFAIVDSHFNWMFSVEVNNFSKMQKSHYKIDSNLISWIKFLPAFAPLISLQSVMKQSQMLHSLCCWNQKDERFGNPASYKKSERMSLQ
mmetsp:Transcript_3045/g.3553  ORF Transcript_3045/g.3553 Transcript_3045/m.3553 type:complete len:92 (-) Transcript_3045:861-1136(-)